MFSLILPNQGWAAEDTTTVVIHRIVFPGDDPSEVAIENNGQIIEEELLGGRPLADATFSVYDVSDRFYQLTADSLTYLEAQKKISEEADQAFENDRLEQDFTKVAEQQTGEDGTATFNLTTYHKGDSGKIYLFMETKVPDTISHKASNLVVMLPYNTNNSDKTLHLYPKNHQPVRKPYFYKHGETSTGTDEGALAGARFRLYKEVENEKYYLHKDIYNNGNTWVNEEESGILTMISGSDGLVHTGEHYLTPGTYYFEETKAPNGYEITEAAKKIPVIIPTNTSDKITIQIDGKNLLMDDAIVFNTKEPDEPNEPDEPSNPDEPSDPPTRTRLPSTSGKTPTTNKLPQTGSRTSHYLIVSGILIVVLVSVIVLINNKKTKEEK